VESLEARETPAVVGALDPTFGTAGVVNTPIPGPGGFFAPVAAAVDSLGRTVVVGQGTGPVSGNTDFEVVRFNADGTRDTAFGAKFFDFSGVDTPNAVAIGAGDSIVVVGNNGISQIAVGALDATGAPLAGFGTAGKTAFNFTGGNGTPRAVTIDPGTGDILLAGSSTGAFAAARLTPAGVLSTTFGTANSGSVRFQVDAAETNSMAFAIATDSQGRIVIGGTAIVGTTKVAVARLTAAGAFDMSFDADGKAVVALPATVTGITINRGGIGVDAVDNVYVGADVDTATQTNTFAVTKLVAATGAIDTTYGAGGTFLSTLAGAGGQEGIEGLFVKPTGQVIVGGSTTAGAGGLNFVVAQLTPQGTIDRTFNPTGPTPGYTVIDIAGTTDAIAGFARGASGRVVAVGGDQSAINLKLARVVTSIEKGTALSVGGSLNGRATIFDVAVGGGPAVSFVTPPTAASPANLFPGFTGNVRTALGDINGDGAPDTILVTGAGTAIRLAVVSGADDTTVLVAPFDPFGGGFTGGGFVAAGDFNGDGRAEFIVTPDQGGGPRVTIFTFAGVGTAPTQLANFFTIDPNFRGGIRVAAGDVNNDAVADLVVAAGFQGGPRINVIDGKTVFTNQAVLANFFAFPDALRNGVFISVGDVNGDGFGDIIVGAGPGGGPVVEVISGRTLTTSGFSPGGALLANFFVGGTDSDRSGVRVAAVDADGDGVADIAVGTGGSVPSRVRVYLGKNLTASGEPATFQDLNPFAAAALADGVYVG